MHDDSINEENDMNDIEKQIKNETRVNKQFEKREEKKKRQQHLRSTHPV